jgi:hypothetical protein
LIVADDGIAERNSQIQALKRQLTEFDKLQAKINEQQQEIDALNCQASYIIFLLNFVDSCCVCIVCG